MNHRRQFQSNRTGCTCCQEPGTSTYPPPPCPYPVSLNMPLLTRSSFSFSLLLFFFFSSFLSRQILITLAPLTVEGLPLWSLPYPGFSSCGLAETPRIFRHRDYRYCTRYTQKTFLQAVNVSTMSRLCYEGNSVDVGSKNSGIGTAPHFTSLQ